MLQVRIGSYNAQAVGEILVTWVYDESGCAAAILDEFCIRNVAGSTVGWVFGVSVFSLKGEHIGWFEDGVLYDLENKVLGFVPSAKGLVLGKPALAPAPVMPPFTKRPCAPTLRGRSMRLRSSGWSSACLASYLEGRPPRAACPAFIAHTANMQHATIGELQR